MQSATSQPSSGAAASAFPVHRRVTTRWADNDVYGHLNNVVYYEFFDSAVNGWLIDATGVDIRELPAIGVVAETSCRYLRQFRTPATCRSGSPWPGWAPPVVYQLGVFAYDGSELDPRPRAVGRFVHVYVDALTRRPVPVPGPVRSALDALEQGRQLSLQSADGAAADPRGPRGSAESPEPSVLAAHPGRR